MRETTGSLSASPSRINKDSPQWAPAFATILWPYTRGWGTRGVMVSSVSVRVQVRSENHLATQHVAEGAIERFHEPYRAAVRSLTRTSPAVADLALTFPGLLFALASDYGTQGARDRCLGSVRAGQTLKQAAATLDFPLWLRRLPAEAFTAPFADLPDSGDFARRIVNHVPAESWKAAGWLDRVLLVRELADDDMALWMAWRSKAVPRFRDINRLVLLCAWAWFSRQPDTFGASLIRQPFDASLGLRKALDEAETWKKRAELAMALGEGVRDTWYEAGNARGYDFVPLKKLEDFLAEARQMDNCLDQFASQVQQRNTRVFSIRKRGKPVANLEIAPHEEDPGMPRIEQLRGPGNRRAAPGVWQAVFAWLSQQPARPLTASRTQSAAARAIARKLWQPYLDSLEGRNGQRHVREYLHAASLFVAEG